VELAVERLTGNEAVPEVGKSGARPVGAFAAQAVLIVIAVYVVVSARALGVWLPQGPGPGFFPLVLAAALIVLSVAWFVQTRRAAGGDSAEDAGPAPWKRPAVTLVSLVVLAAGLNFSGFQAGMLLFLLFHLRVMGRCRWLTSVVIAVAGSVGAFHLFNDFLLVPLPYATVPPLTWLGV
jgi:putative tricarboxylic transport membrane protein